MHNARTAIIAAIAVAFTLGCVTQSGASVARSVLLSPSKDEGRTIAPSSITIAYNDHDRDDKKNKGRKIRRHGHVAPPAWYNGSNGYFSGGSWHHKRVTHPRVRDRDHR